MTKEALKPIDVRHYKVTETGQVLKMTKEELKNKCVDTSCPVLSINNQNMRRIAELETENAELKTKKIPRLERKIASIRGAHSVDCKKLNARLEQVERLKKENAELKEEIKNNEDLAAVAYMQGAESQKKKYEKWLIKAKAIIKRMLPLMPSGYNDMGNCDFIWEVKEEAEQFLKEVYE